MAYVEEPSSALQRQISDHIPLWQVPFATAGALIDCLSCPRSVTSESNELSIRLRSSPPQHQGVRAWPNKACFTNMPLQQDALPREIIHVPREQVYAQTYAPSLGSSHHRVSVKTMSCLGTPVQTYVPSPVQYVPGAPNVRSQVQPMPYTVRQQDLGNHPTSSPFFSPVQMSSSMVPPMVGSRMTTHSVQACDYFSTDSALSNKKHIGYPLTVSKGVQVGSVQKQEGNAETECTGCRKEDDCDLPSHTELNGHSGSLGEERKEEKRGDVTIEQEAAVSNSEKAEEIKDLVQQEETKDDTDELSGEANERSQKEDSTAAKEQSKVEASLVGSTLSEGNSSVYYRVNGTTQATTGETKGAWPVGYVPPKDPSDYKELRLGNSVYLMGGTFYLSDTGAYLLGLRS
ncbi:hypothetical protein TGARI_272520 [Toxoplasma gondii ARI]|uniref:Uncharacterized protein n=2 Tax=Toxoplasma gondii TaxID=5811 RepID=A0A2G8Y2Y2_TOXGO|nr:hypothetical protein TGARI_272520 [Toxoplasma gondii ARI]PIM01369.1 hypothetical protein TGCOUG_272520 [Toxoplasma gondii COUG]